VTEEGFREIQLNGKQLVFLFMAATVVSVVIFLCGVLVGRGVRADRPLAAGAAGAAVAPDPVAGPPPQPSVASTPAPSAEPPPPAEELTYFNRLEKNDPPPENMKSPSAEPAPQSAAPARAAAVAVPVTASKTPPADAPSASAAAGEPPGAGFAVQVATFPDRPNAELLAKRLVGKGYPAFVTGPVKGGAKMIYRVRVGKYQDKHEAEAVSNKLEKEEQFKPWIAR
jgi:cell division protein FtsN